MFWEHHKTLLLLTVVVGPLLLIPFGIYVAVIRGHPELAKNADRQTRTTFYVRRAALVTFCVVTWLAIIGTPVGEMVILVGEAMDSRGLRLGFHWLGLVPLAVVLVIWWFILAFGPEWRGEGNKTGPGFAENDIPPA
jgi:hypothetical protein